MDTIQNIFGRKIRQTRKRRGMTQEQLAELSSLSLQYIGEVERGKRNPSLTSIGKLAKAFELPVSELFDVEMLNFSEEEMKDALIARILEADEKTIQVYFAMARAFWG